MAAGIARFCGSSVKELSADTEARQKKGKFTAGQEDKDSESEKDDESVKDDDDDDDTDVDPPNDEPKWFDLERQQNLRHASGSRISLHISEKDPLG